MNRLNKSNVAVFIMALSLGIATAIYGQDLIHNNDQAINVIVTVFSILAGFLVAIIAIIGDSVLTAPGSWRSAELEVKKASKHLIRHELLFYLYLITLGLIFFTVLVKDKCPEIRLWIERIYLCLSTMAFVFSLKLPSSIIKIQQKRIDNEIEKRRRDAGIR